MNLLLDTHAFLWWLDGDRRLRKKSRDLIADESHVVYLSAASAWEIATKYRIGKLPGAEEVARDVPQIASDQGFLALPITMRHAQHAGLLSGQHRDPFDRMLVAQALQEVIPIVSSDRIFDTFGAERIW